MAIYDRIISLGFRGGKKTDDAVDAAKVAQKGGIVGKGVKGAGVLGAGVYGAYSLASSVLGGVLSGVTGGASYYSGTDDFYGPELGGRPGLGGLMALPGAAPARAVARPLTGTGGDNTIGAVVSTLREILMEVRQLKSIQASSIESDRRVSYAQSLMAREQNTEAYSRLRIANDNGVQPRTAAANDNSASSGGMGGLSKMAIAGIVAAVAAYFTSGSASADDDTEKSGDEAMTSDEFWGWAGIIPGLFGGIPGMIAGTALSGVASALNDSMYYDHPGYGEEAARRSQKNVKPAQRYTGEVLPQAPLNDKNLLMNMIAYSEGTDEENAHRRGIKSGYDISLGYGRYRDTGKDAGEKPLTEMTLREVRAEQDKIRQNHYNEMIRQGKTPEQARRMASSAVGRYQIVGATMFGKDGKGGLVGELGLDMDAKFTPEIQDRMARRLIERRVKQATNKDGTINVDKLKEAFKNEWASLPGADEKALQVIGKTKFTSDQVVDAILNGSYNVHPSMVQPTAGSPNLTAPESLRANETVAPIPAVLAEALAAVQAAAQAQPVVIVDNSTGGTNVVNNGGQNTTGAASVATPALPSGYADHWFGQYVNYFNSQN